MTEMAELIASLAMTQLNSDTFQGRSPSFGWKRVFGGHLLAQALVAAQRTVTAERFVHSLQAYFHSPGDAASAVTYKVERIRDGKSFAARRTVAEQHGKLLLSMEASFHVDEGGPQHQQAMPLDVPPPGALPDPATFLESRSADAAQATRDLWRQPMPFEVRPVVLDHYVTRVPRAAVQHVWIRPKAQQSFDRVQGAAMLAYLSDMTLLGVATFAHGCALTDPVVQSSSISHAMWFHRPCALDDWLLYAQDSPSSQNALGIARGGMFARGGALIATVVQEGLLRFIETAEPRP